MSGRCQYALLNVRELTHGIHDLPDFDTSYFRLFALRLDPHGKRLPIDRSAETLLLVTEGRLAIAWREAGREATELGEGDTLLTNPPAVEALLAGEEGATLLAMVSRRSQARPA